MADKSSSGSTIYDNIVSGKTPSYGEGYNNYQDNSGNYYFSTSEPSKKSSSSYSSGGGSSSDSDYSTSYSAPEQQAQTPMYEPTPDYLSSAQYWYQEKAKFEADPYVSKDQPGYQNPDGFSKEQVNMIYQDLETKNQGSGKNWYETATYNESDPTYGMINTWWQDGHPLQTEEPTTGQTGEAFQEQPLQDVTSPASTPTGRIPEVPVTPMVHAEMATPTTPTVTTPAAPPTEQLLTSQVYKDTLNSLQWLGMEKGEAEILALDAAREELQTNPQLAQEKTNVNIAGLGGMVKTEVGKFILDLTKNAMDIESDIAGVSMDTVSRDNILENLKGSTLRRFNAMRGEETNFEGQPVNIENTRAHYTDLLHQGSDQYRQLLAEGHAPAMNHEEFANKYAEYLYRVETDKRYNATLDLTGFSKYMPEGTPDISGNARLENSMFSKYEGNPVNAEREENPEWTAAKEMIKQYVFNGDENDLSNNLDSIMTGTNQDVIPNESRPLTQAEIDEIIPQLLEANPIEDMEMFINFEKSGSMDNLDTWMKQLMYYMVPGTQGIEGADPLKEKALKPFVTSVMSAGILANIGSIAGGVIGGPVGERTGRVLGFALGCGISYAEQLTGLELPYYDQILEFFDKGANAVESYIGKYSLAYEDVFGEVPFQVPGSLYRELRNAANYWDMIRSSKQKLESQYDPTIVKMMTESAADLGVNFSGSSISNTMMNVALGLDEAFHGGNPEDVMLHGPNEVYRFNLGQAEKVILEQSGNDRLRAMINVGQLMHELGMSYEAISAWRDRTVAEIMGTNAFTNEIIYNELGDPLNMTEGIQANTMYGIGKLTGDTNLQTAARANGALDAGSFAVGLLPSGVDTVVTQVAKALGKEVHRAGGINEIMETYRNENRYGNLEGVTRFGKKWSGIDENGQVTELLPQNNINPTIWQRIENRISKTDDTRVLDLTNASSNYINIGIYNANGDPVKITAFLDQLENPDLISPNDPLYDLTHSAMFNTYREEIAQAVTNTRKQTNAILDQWSQFEDNRRALARLSEMLGETPDKIIDYAENKKYNLAKLIEQKAEQNPSILQGNESAEALVEKLAPFVKTNKHNFRAPWSPAELSFQISNAIGDGMQKVMIDKYNITSKPTIYRLADVIKASQNFVFLGISGTYLMNNILNNVVTRGLTGVGGWTLPSKIDNFFQRMGFRSERFGDSLAQEIGQKSSGEKTQYVRMQEALSAKREAITDGSQFKKALREVKKSANWINQHLGIFGNLSGKVEESESKQAIYSGTKQYMDRTWKPGVNLTRMPGALEQALDAQAPGMKEAIYSAVRNGMNMQEINDAILGDYVQPGLKQSFIDAASERYGANAENVVGQLFDKTGILDELKEALDGKDVAGREKVFEDFTKLMEIENLAEVSEHLSNLSDSIKTDITAEGFNAALEHASEMVDVDLGTRLGTMNQWDKEFTLRLREPFTVKEWQARVNTLQEKINAQYQQLYAEKKQIWDGILQGLGMDDQYKTEYIKALGNLTDLWESFYKGDGKNPGQEQFFKDYRAKAAFVEGEDPKGWQLRAQTAWGEYLDAMTTLYDNSAQAEMTAMEAMDKAFAEGMKAVTGRGDELGFVDELQARVRELRQREIELNKKIRQQERELKTYKERDLLWEKNEAERRQYRKDVADAQKEMYDRLKPYQKHAVGVANDPTKVDYDAIVKADIGHEEAQKMKAASEKYSDRAWEKFANNNTQVRPEFFDMNDMPTIEEAEELFTRIDKRLAGTKGYDSNDLLSLIYTSAALSDEQVSDTGLQSLMNNLTDEELSEIMLLSARYGSSAIAELSLVDDVEKIARDISQRAFPKVVVTDKNDTGQKRYRREVNKQRENLYNDLRMLARDIVKNTQASDPELFARVNQHITAQDWQTINSIASKYNAILNELNTPVQPDTSRFHTEQLAQSEIYGNYNIVAHVMDGDQVIALVPDKMPVTEINYSDDVKFQVLGISPDDPQGIVYMAGDEPRTASPKAFQPAPNEVESTAYSPAMDVNSTPALDPYAMANQEMLYRDVLPLLSSVAERYESDLLNAQTHRLSGLDETTRALVKSYLDNVVAKDLSNAKYKAMRFGEMMRDIALLNYSDRYGFDNFLTMIAPYQFWLTRSANQWIKRIGSHPRLFSHYQRVKDLEDKNERDYLPNRLEGKMGIPLIGWPSFYGGRTFVNLSQLLPLNTFLNPLENIDDDKHVAEKKAENLLEEWLNVDGEDGITWEEYQQAMTHEGPVWERALAEASLGQDLDPDFGSLWKTYFSFSLPVNWAEAYFNKTGNKLSHFPMTNVGNALSQAIARIDPENATTQRIAEVVRERMSAPERKLRDLFGFEYNEFGAYADSLIERRLASMLQDGTISEPEWTIAMLEKDGNPIYEKAVQDVREEQALKVPGYGAVAGVEDLVKSLFTKENRGDAVKNLMIQLAISPFGQYTFTQGEEDQRRAAATDKPQAYADKESGLNPNAVNEYYDTNPAEAKWSIRNKKTPDEKNRALLYDLIKQDYFDLDEYQQKDVANQMPHFYDAIINPETRAVETMPIEELAGYARALHGTLPFANMPFIDESKVPEITINRTADPILAQVEEFDTYKKEHFPGIDTAQSYYYSLEDKKSQQEFLSAFPALQAYWDWKKPWEEEHPEAYAWLQRRTAYNDIRYTEPVWNALDTTVQNMIMDDSYKKDEVINYYIQKAITESNTTRKVTREDLQTYATWMLMQGQ